MIRQLLTVLLLPTWVWAADTTNLTVTGIAEFTAAYRGWDRGAFAQAAGIFARACQQAPDSCTNFYWWGVAEFHRVLQLHGEAGGVTNRQESARALQTAVEALKRAVQLDPDHGESHALLSTLYGLSIAASPARAVWLGPRVTDQEKLARQQSAGNPRVLYLAGMTRYYGPGLLGGKAEGLKLLLAAEQLFEAEASKPRGPTEPGWGRSTCLVYIGKTYDALGQPAKAEEYWRKALEVNPQDKLAREQLETREK